MKKSLLLMAVLLTAVVFVKAQEDSVTWIADDYCVNAGLVFEDVALAPETAIEVGALTFVARDGDGSGWKYKSNDVPDFEYNGVTYKANLVQGQVNPKDGRPTDADGNPAASAKFTSTKDGRLDVTFKVAPRKRFWVTAIPTANLALHDIADSASNANYMYAYAEGAHWWGGYWDPATNPPTYYDGTCLYTSDPSGDEYTYYTGASINIEADKTYFFFVSGSKLQLCGLTFVAATGGVSVNDHLNAASVVSTQYYNIAGQQLSKPQLGSLNIIVKTMSDGTVKAEKTYIRK